ncbi:MAG: Vps62-related protein [Cyclobacteriaceae bacterium]
MNSHIIKKYRFPCSKCLVILLMAIATGTFGQNVITYPIGEFKNVDSLSDSLCADDPFICGILNRYAPKFIFHSNEKFHPSTVEYFLEHASLGYRYSKKKTKKILPAGEVSGNILGTQIHGDKGDLTLEEIGKHQPSFTKSRSRGEYYLEAAEPSRDQVLAGMNPKDFDNQLYAYSNYGLLQDADTLKGYQLQYWLFFPNNGSLGHHEGDWEGITVTVNLNGDFISATYLAHGIQRSFLPEQIIFADSIGNEQRSKALLPDSVFSHPIVFISKSTHASYPAGKIHRRFPLPSDKTKRGTAFNSFSRTQLLPNRFMAANDLKWVQFAGRWGRTKTKWFNSPDAAPYKWKYYKGTTFRHKKSKKLRAKGRAVAAEWNRLEFEPGIPVCDTDNRWLMMFIHRDLREQYFAELYRRDDPLAKYHNLDLYNFDNDLTGIMECTQEGDTYLMFEGVNYGGEKYTVTPGSGLEIRRTEKVDGNDKISSICWENCGEESWVSFFKNKGYRGESYFLNSALNSSVADFDETKLGNDVITSIRFCLPVDYKLVLYDRPDFNFSEFKLELQGQGKFTEIDFDVENVEMKDVIQSARILRMEE